jgi:hypothetical protein
VIYAVMGWIVLVAVKPLLAALGTAGFAWLASGGVLYTVGIIFFALDHRLRHAHGIWHLFVIAGSLLHFVAIILLCPVIAPTGPVQASKRSSCAWAVAEHLQQVAKVCGGGSSARVTAYRVIGRAVPAGGCRCWPVRRRGP